MKEIVQSFVQWIADTIITVLAAPCRAMIEQTQSTLVTAVVVGSAIIGGAIVWQSANITSYNALLVESQQELESYRIRDAQLRALRSELQLKQDFPDAEIPE